MEPTKKMKDEHKLMIFIEGRIQKLNHFRN